MIVESSAPANIALIKYMGKLDSGLNRPTNASLSYTLSELQTTVRLTAMPELLRPSKKDSWAPLEADGIVPIQLSLKGQDRFLRHLAFLKKHYSVSQVFAVESGNNFPSDCGLASSASSFAALTKAAAKVFLELGMLKAMPEERELAWLSQQGSGSSCRSFMEPWVVWDEDGVRPVEIPMTQLYHQVIVVDSGIKKVSSSEAHQRVTTSALFLGRKVRAEARLQDLLAAFRVQDWERAYTITWNEFWDMHSLFETSQTPFGYMTKGSLEVLHFIRQLWDEQRDGPLVTMDAGANVHLLYRRDQMNLWTRVRNHFTDRFRLIETERGNANDQL